MPGTTDTSTTTPPPPLDAAGFDDLLRRVAVTLGGLPDFCPLRECRRVQRCIGPADAIDGIDGRPACWDTALRAESAIAALVLGRLFCVPR